MFKEKRNKGFTAVLLISIVFFSLATISGFLGQIHKKPTERFADTTDTGKEVTMSVYGIYPEPVGEVDGGTVVYIVQYSKEGEGKFAVVESKVKDESINKLLEKAESLADNPATLTGIQLEPLSKNVNNKSRNNRIVDLSGFLDSILEPDSTVALNMNSSVYLSLTEHSKDGWWHLISAAIFGGIGLVTLVSAFLLRKKSVAAFEELYQAYPELQGNVENLTGLAEFYDESLKVILYNNHLITYFKGTQALDLRDVEQLYLVETRINRSLITNKVYQFCYIRKNAKKKQDMTLKTTKKVQEQLEELWDLISNKFPEIHIGV